MTGYWLIDLWDSVLVLCGWPVEILDEARRD